METFKAKVVSMLKEHCSCAAQLTTFMGSPVIYIEDPNALTEIETLEIEVEGLICRFFPERQEDIMITFRREGMEDKGFKVWKAN